MEKILKIEETTFDNKDGFIITTDTQVIKLGIENYQCCCEDWGYFMSKDNLVEFIGADLITIRVTDTALETWKEIEELYEGGVMFINLETTNGLLQFVAYNKHNGYYGHDACVISKELNESKFL